MLKNNFKLSLNQLTFFKSLNFFLIILNLLNIQTINKNQ
jgi:hypothetical protein